MFLATLQLTNMGNVALSTEGNLDDGSLTLQVELLSRERHEINVE